MRIAVLARVAEWGSLKTMYLSGVVANSRWPVPADRHLLRARRQAGWTAMGSSSFQESLFPSCSLCSGALAQLRVPHSQFRPLEPPPIRPPGVWEETPGIGGLSLDPAPSGRPGDLGIMWPLWAFLTWLDSRGWTELSLRWCLALPPLRGQTQGQPGNFVVRGGLWEPGQAKPHEGGSPGGTCACEYVHV